MSTVAAAQGTPAIRRGARAKADLPRRRGLSARFWACTALLFGGAIATRVAMSYLDLSVQKKPVPLRAALGAADDKLLGPRYVLAPNQPPFPSEETLTTLGTHEFLDWRLIDTDAAAGARTRMAEVVVTYYTGGYDLVPHVPEECMSAGGYEAIGQPSDLPIRAAGCGAPNDTIRVRVARFHAPGGRVNLDGSGGNEVAILYFFHCCGKYCTTRGEVQRELSNPFEKYSYYMKVELKFTDESLRSPAPAEESLRAAEPLLERLLPLLFSGHLQWDNRDKLGAAAPESQG